MQTQSRLVRTLLGLFQAVVVLSMIAFLWGGWYLHHKGFSRSMRERLAAEFSKRGVEMQLRRLTLDPFQGLVASDLKIYDQSEDRQLLAEVSRVALDINIGGLFRGETFLNAIDLRDTSLSIPVDPGSKSSPKLKIDSLSARVAFPPDQIQIMQASGVIGGIGVSLKGTLLNPHQYKAKPGGDPARSRRFAESLLAELGKLSFEGKPPLLEIEFAGDLGKPDDLRLEKGTLRGEGIRRGAVRLRQIAADFSVKDGEVEVRRFEAADLRGKLELVGHASLTQGAGEFWMRSTLDVQAWADELFGRKLLAEVNFYDPPAIEARGKFGFKEEKSFLVTGQAGVKRFGLRSIIFDGFETDFALDGKRIFLHQLAIRHHSGKLQAEIYNAPGDFRLDLQSTLDPTTLAPLFGGKLMALLGEWKFEDSPSITLTASGASLKPEDLVVKGQLKMGRSSFRGLGIKSLTTPIEFRNRAAIYQNFRLVRDHGEGTGTFVYDFGRGEARMEKIVSTIDPVDAMRWVNPQLVPAILPYRFKTPPHLEVDGVVNPKSPKGTELRVKVEAPRGMKYTFLGKELDLNSIRSLVAISGTTLMLRNVQGELMGGRISGEADISISREKPGHKAIVRLEDVDFQSLTKLYFGYEQSKGSITGRYAFSGRGGEMKAMQGEGSLEVVNGNVFAIPFLGPISMLLNEIVPGMGISVARKATSTFTVEEGIFRTKDFLVDSSAFVMTGGGWLDLVEDRMNFSVRVNARGIPGVLLFPVSKLFEYVSDGKRSDPQWRPKRLPKELFNR